MDGNISTAPRFLVNALGRPIGIRNPLTDADEPLKPAPLGEYVGFPATNAGWIGNATGATRGAMARAVMYARASITPDTALQVLYVNAWSNSGAETNGGADLTVRASIEYPAGTFTQVLFGGSATAVIPPGRIVKSDPVSVTIPDGARYFVRTWMDAAADNVVPYINVNGIADTAAGEAVTNSVSSVTDQTMSGTVSDGGNSGALMIRPFATIGKTTRPSGLSIADSRGQGNSDSFSNSLGYRGELGRILGPLMGYAVMACGGELASTFNDFSPLTRTLLKYATDVFYSLGINDIASGVNAATTEASIVAGLTLCAGGNRRLWITTLPPEGTTSSDTFATVANQTASARNSVRVAVNSYIRTLPRPADYVLEVADTMESARGTGKWKVGYVDTADGTHELRIANEALVPVLAGEVAAIVKGF